MKKHSIVLSFILPALILAVWWLVSLYSDVPRAILPSPANVAAAFTDAMRSGLLITDLLISLKRLCIRAVMLLPCNTQHLVSCFFTDTCIPVVQYLGHSPLRNPCDLSNLSDGHMIPPKE